MFGGYERFLYICSLKGIVENISIAIKALFTKISGDEILKNAGFWNTEDVKSQEFKHLDTDVSESMIVNRLLKLDSNRTIDQISMLEQIIQNKWMAKDNTCMTLKFHEKDSMFNILLYFTSKCLITKSGDPLCQYNYLLRWHTLTTQVGEDLLTTAFLASRDLKLEYDRKSFDWDAFLGHNSKELAYLFEKPMAELHMHLNGSSFNFDLSWQCIMNHIGEMQRRFEKEYPHHQYKDLDKELYEKMRKAALIRFYLAGAVGCIEPAITLGQLNDGLCNYYKDSRKEGPASFFDLITQCRIRNQKKAIEEYIFLREKTGCEEDTTDAIIEQDIEDYIPVGHYLNECIENKVLASERKFMYEVFKTIFNDDKNEKADVASLFYAYLAYKSYFRNEILQLNERVGFANFASYEEKKTDFILDEYYHLLYKAAIEGFLEKGKRRHLEARIVPKETEEEIVKMLNGICREIAPRYNDQYDFIFHFIKKRDERKDHPYRHFELREQIKKQSYAIYKFRCNQDNWKDGNSLVGKVVGLDAANSEIFCRPEVYAQAFRFLRGHKMENDKDVDSYPDDLNVTYHIGEDFMDIPDGLRAVEEALLFLNLKNGDRLGHALVLGTDVRSYYARRYFSICASKQVLLDNLVWLHHKCIRLIGYTQLCGWLEIMFLKYFTEIYRNHEDEGGNIIESFFAEESEDDLSDDLHDYYLSWLLRGHSPLIGKDLAKENYEKVTGIDKQWLLAGINHHEWAEVALRNERARNLFDAYHSKKYAKKGDVGDTITIPYDYIEEWIQLLEKIQEQLLEKVESRHIAIECNPSSNYKIGEIDRYDEHPIVKFFNYGLSTPYPRHDISVSINTDDQGVFSTSLEREYSLMALALERNQTQEYKNSPRAIVDWLDRVRQMSLEQRFKH